MKALIFCIATCCLIFGCKKSQTPEKIPEPSPIPTNKANVEEALEIQFQTSYANIPKPGVYVLKKKNSFAGNYNDTLFVSMIRKDSCRFDFHFKSISMPDSMAIYKGKKITESYTKYEVTTLNALEGKTRVFQSGNYGKRYVVLNTISNVATCENIILLKLNYIEVYQMLTPSKTVFTPYEYILELQKMN